MKVKTKLTFGVGFLFCLIGVLTGVSILYLNSLKKDTNNILQANYNTLEYSRNMLLALDEMPENTKAIQTFEYNLENQLKNGTELGELEMTHLLVELFSDLQKDITDDTTKLQIRKHIVELMRLNMNAIRQKSQIANDTAENAIVWVVVTGASCFAIALVLLIMLPRNIANPIRQLTESIKQIANQNYSQRIDLDSHSEFGELANSFNLMAERLEEYSNSKLSKILKEKRRVETLINNMHDPVIGVDENKLILFINDVALKITGLKRAEILGKQIQDIAVTNDLIRTLIVDLIDPLVKMDNVPLKIFSDDKESYFEKEIIEIETDSIDGQRGELIGHVIVLKNITFFKELDSAKTNFIATISHELKTPISSIKLSVHLLEHEETGTLNEEQQQLIEGIKTESARLLQITGELLNMSQVETGNIQLNIQQANPHQIVQYAIDTVRMQAEQKRLKMEINTDSTLPPIMADAEKTTWVLINFLTNAIRYSTEDSELIISLVQQTEGIQFAVKDMGRGIEERYQKKIFDRYFQIPGSAKSGSGLGLAISKEFIESQGGSIGMVSDPGMGSTFYFTMPYYKG